MRAANLAHGVIDALMSADGLNSAPRPSGRPISPRSA